MRRPSTWDAAAILLLAFTGVAGAQEPHAVDTVAILRAAAVAWRAADTPTDAGKPADTWFVRAHDSLTVKFAAIIGKPTKPAPVGLVCAYRAPTNAPTGYVVTVELRVLSPGRILLSVADSCRYDSVDPPHAFFQLELFEVVRRDGVWVARHAGSAIS